MSTRANLSVWNREFHLGSDGYPSYVLEEMMSELLRQGKDKALLECYESLIQGWGSDMDYSYDFTDQNGDIIVIVSGHGLEDYDWAKCPSWEVISELHPNCDSVKLKLRGGGLCLTTNG